MDFLSRTLNFNFAIMNKLSISREFRFANSKQIRKTREFFFPRKLLTLIHLWKLTKKTGNRNKSYKQKKKNNLVVFSRIDFIETKCLCTQYMLLHTTAL